MPINYAKITQSYLQDTANAIRAKNGKTRTYTPLQMTGAIRELVGLCPITDLTGTKWRMNDILMLTGFNEDTFSLTGSFGDCNMSIELWLDSTYVGVDGVNYLYENGIWQNSNFKNATITSGTDATNSTLIDWFWNNGILLEPTF